MPANQPDIKIAPLRDGIAGRSRDGKTVFIDPLVPAWMRLAIRVHEQAELRFMLAGMSYAGAHQKATSYERHYCESRGLDWPDYDRTYKRVLAAIMAREPKPTEPPDLFHGDRGEMPDNTNYSHLHKSESLDYGSVHVPRLGGSKMKPDEDELMEKEDDEEEMHKAGSDSDFVRERLKDEAGGIEAYSQALESVQDPKLKEILQAIQEDEQKHNAALEQWLQENDPEAQDEHEGEESPGEEDEEDLDKDEDGGKGELIDQIRAVLEAHEAEKADEDEPGEEDLDKEDSDGEEDTEKSDDEDEDDKPDFLKEDEEDEEDGKITKSFRVPIIKGDRQIVYGVVSEPGTIDLQGDRLSESEIRKACHKFMQTSQKINKEHEGPAKADIIESYIAPTDFRCGGQTVKKGSWVMAVKVQDPDLWQAVKKGEITGFSIAGQGERTPF